MKTITIKVPDVAALGKKIGEVLGKLIPPSKIGGFALTNFRRFNSKILKTAGNGLTNLSHKVEPPKKRILTYPIMVRGTSYTQEIIRTLAKEEKVFIVLENDPTWPNKVSVYIGGKLVGHIPNNPVRDKVDYALMIRDKIRKRKFKEITEWHKKGGGDVNFGLDIVVTVIR